MQTLNGKQVATPDWWGSLQVIEELLYYDGPLLSLVGTEDGRIFFKIWCDVDNTVDRHAFIQVASEDVEKYKVAEHPIAVLRQLMEHPKMGTVFFF